MSKLALGVGIGLTVAGSFLSGTKTAQEKIAAVGKEVKRLNAKRLKVGELMRVKQETGGVGAAFQKAAKDAKVLGFNIADVEKQSKKLEKQFKRTKAAHRSSLKLEANKQSFQTLNRRVMKAVGFGFIAAAPIKKAAEFEQAMARVGAVAGSSKEELAILSAEAKRLGATTSFTASQAAEGMQYLGMAGFKTNQIVAAMPGLLNMAKAGQTDLGRASDIASDMLTAFGMEAAQMPRMADVLTKSFTSSNVTLEMLGETMKYVAPIAKTAGMSLEETAAMAGLLGNIGIKGSQAGTVMRAMLNRLAAPLGPAQKALNSLHINPLDEDGNLRNVPELLKEVAAATQNMGSGERMGIFKKIFGAEAGAGAAALIEQSGVGELDKFIDILNNSKGAAAKLAAEMDDTATGAMLKLGSAVESVALSVGDLFLPVIKFAAGILSTVATSMSDFVQNHKIIGGAIAWLIGGIVAGAAVLLVFKYITLGVSSALNFATVLTAGWANVHIFLLKVIKSRIVQMSIERVKIIGNAIAERMSAAATWVSTMAKRAWAAVTRGNIILTTVSAARTIAFGVAQRTVALATKAWTAAQWLLNAAMTANPIGLVIAGVTLLVGGAALLIKNWSGVGDFFGKIWDGILAGIDAVGKAWDWFLGLFSSDDKKAVVKPVVNQPVVSSSASSVVSQSSAKNVKNAEISGQIPVSSVKNDSPHITIEQNITVNGGDVQGVTAAVQSANSGFETRVTQILERYFENNERVRFA